MYFTKYKLHNYLTLFTVLLAGCAAFPKSQENISSSESSFNHQALQTNELKAAKNLIDRGSFYESKKEVQKVIDSGTKTEEAEIVMAKILEKEIAEHKEQILKKRVRIELSDSEAENEIKTWLERSKSLLHLKQYDLALFAAEKVFLYDPTNTRASELIDLIKGQAIKEGKADLLFLSKVYEEEIAERVVRYRTDASNLLKNHKYEQAKFTIQKILLLEPEDPTALELYDRINRSIQAEGTL